MKKLLLIVALLTISLTLTFAQDVTAKIVGEAGTKFEVDLDPENPSSGFVTWASASIEIDANTGGKELKSDQQVYGYVKISNLDLGQFRMGFYNSADGWAQAWNGGFQQLWVPWNPNSGGPWAQLVAIDMAQTLGTNARGSEPKNPSIEAKIIAGQIYAKFDGNTYCRAERFFDDRTMQFKEDVLGLQVVKLWTDFGHGSGIVELGYSGDAVAIAAKVSSASSAAVIADNVYSLGADVSIKAIPNLEASVGVYTQMTSIPDAPTPIHFGVKVGYTVQLSEDMSVKPYGGAEIQMSGVDGADPMMEIAGGVNLKWAGVAWDYAWSLGDAIVDYWLGNRDLTPTDEFGGGNEGGWPQHFINFSGANLYVNYLSLSADLNAIGIRATMFDDTGDSGLLPMIGVGLIGIVNMYLESDIVTAYNEVGVGLWLEAIPAPGVKPFVGLQTLMPNDTNILVQTTELSAGVEVTAIPNVIITLAYDGKGRNITTDVEGPGAGKLGILRAQFRFKYY